MKSYKLEEATIIFDNKDIRIVQHPDKQVVIGALTRPGMVYLTQRRIEGKYDKFKKVRALVGGLVFLVFV